MSRSHSSDTRPRAPVLGVGTMTALLATTAAAALATVPAPATAQAPGRFAGDGIVIGWEYAILNNRPLVRNMAAAYAETGIPGMKHYVEVVEWGNMQRGPDAPIDFSKFDMFVLEYQNQGFTELTISLKPHSRWASVDVKLLSSTNGSPKPEYRGLFQAWVQAVIERYDADGVDDMPGLRWPIRYVEIGNEFSSYQPEPVEEYLVTLQLAYEAAHRAYDDVLVGHAAFLVTPVNMDVDPSRYEEVWETTRRVDEHHDLADMRAVLDRPDIFDIINLHNLGSPYEIEAMMRWLEYETGLRGYTKPVIISDTTPTSYIGWGPATTCRGPTLGVLAYPATEEDRCELAEYFTRLVRRDQATLDWTRGFVAADHVQRAVIAAEQGIKVINLAFTGDISFMTVPFARAGAGISAWGGGIRANLFFGNVLERYPSFHAVKQLMGHLQGYQSIERVMLEGSPGFERIYRVQGRDGEFYIVWRDPGEVVLPGRPGETSTFEIPVGDAGGAIVETVITGMGVTEAVRRQVPARGGSVLVEVGHTPVFVVPGGA